MFSMTQVALASESLTQILLQHDIRVEKEVPKPADLLIVFSVHGVRSSSIQVLLLRNLLARKLEAAGISNHVFLGDFEKYFLHGDSSQEDLVCPKLIVDIGVSSEGSDFSFQMSLVEYREDSKKSFHPSVTWMKSQDMKGISVEQAENNLIQAAQKVVRDLLGIEGKRLKTSYPLTAGTLVTSEKVTYQLRFKDSDNLRNHMFLGVALGTPAIGNIVVGFWGSRSIPLVITASGMYYGQSQRGVQLDTSWAFDNTGDFRQTVGVSLALLNDASSNTTVTGTDEFGRTTETTTVTTNLLKPYLGPSYSVQWNNFRLGGGAGIGLDPTAQSAFRVLLQLGYSLPIGF
jgi:hypothetical protein